MFYSRTEENNVHTTEYLNACLCTSLWPGLAAEALQGCRLDREGAVEAVRGAGLLEEGGGGVIC